MAHNKPEFKKLIAKIREQTEILSAAISKIDQDLYEYLECYEAPPQDITICLAKLIPVLAELTRALYNHENDIRTAARPILWIVRKPGDWKK